jgi:hypothetical protein
MRVMLKKFFSSALLFIGIAFLSFPQLYAQDEDGKIVVIGEHVGEIIDLEERNIYNLFPDIEGFKSAVFLMLPDGSYMLKITRVDKANGEEIIIRTLIEERDIKRYANKIDANPSIIESTPTEKHHLIINYGYPIMVSLSIAGSLRNNWFIGMGAGLGLDYISMLSAGDHFSEGGIYDVLQVSFFTRYQPSDRWQVDFGLRGAIFLHDNHGSDIPVGGPFIGGYINPMVGWRHFKVGCSVVAGRFWESNYREFGIGFAPFTAQIIIPW